MVWQSWRRRWGAPPAVPASGTADAGGTVDTGSGIGGAAGTGGAAGQTLYQKYGTAIPTVVDDAVAGVLADCEIAPYFAVVGTTGHDSVARLKSCLRLQFTVLFGGPGSYPGVNDQGDTCADMASSHAGLGIPGAVFDKFVMDFGGVLKADGVADPDITTIATAVTGLKAQIVSTTPVENRPATAAPRNRSRHAVPTYPESSAVCRAGAGLDSGRRGSLHRGDGVFTHPRRAAFDAPTGNGLSGPFRLARGRRGASPARGAGPARPDGCPGAARPRVGARRRAPRGRAELGGGARRDLHGSRPTIGAAHLRAHRRLRRSDLRLSPDGRLVSASTLRARLPGRGAAGSFAALRQGLSAQLGEGELAGAATAAALEGGPLHTARLQYRFTDYLATVTAMNLPTGVALREQYESARD